MNQLRTYTGVINVWDKCTEKERIALIGAGVVTILSLSHMAMRNGYSFSLGSFSLLPSTQLV